MVRDIRGLRMCRANADSWMLLPRRETDPRRTTDEEEA